MSGVERRALLYKLIATHKDGRLQSVTTHKSKAGLLLMRRYLLECYEDDIYFEARVLYDDCTEQRLEDVS